LYSSNMRPVLVAAVDTDLAEVRLLIDFITCHYQETASSIPH